MQGPGPGELSLLEKDRYSVTTYLQERVLAAGWSLGVDMVRDHWPTADEIEPPCAFVLMDFNRTAAWELGSHGKERELFVHIYATNDSERDRLAEGICDLVRDLIPQYDWTDGNDIAPTIIGYFNVEGDVEFRPVRASANAPDVERWRAVVQATLSRQDV